MKWKTNIFKEKPAKIGDRRTVTRFLFFPKTLPELDIQEENLLECEHVETTRWLEFAKIRQKCIHTNAWNMLASIKWIDVKWMD